MPTVLDTTFDQAINAANADDGERLFGERAGVHVADLHELTREITNDLDANRFGIGWWAPYPDDKRRIFISDYLLQCTHSVARNAVEAALHMLEGKAAHDASSERMAHAVRLRRVGQDTYEADDLEVPEPASLVDLLLPSSRISTSADSFARSVPRSTRSQPL